MSPINAQNRALIVALRPELDAHGIDLPIYFGNRNWHPFLADTLREMRADGVEAPWRSSRRLRLVLGCRQYRENILAAQAEVGTGGARGGEDAHVLQPPGLGRGKCRPCRGGAGRGPGRASGGSPRRVHGALDPGRDGEGSRYESQLAEAPGSSPSGRRRATPSSTRAGADLRSVPWLEPDIVRAHSRACRARRPRRRALARRVRLRPRGGAVRPRRRGAEVAEEMGVGLVRARTRGDPPGVRRDDPRADPGAARSVRAARALGRFGPSHDVCRPAAACRAAQPGRAGRHVTVAVRDRLRGVRAPAEHDPAPAELHVRVVVLGLGEFADAVHERERLGEVREPELSLERPVDLAPSHRRRHAPQYDAR